VLDTVSEKVVANGFPGSVPVEPGNLKFTVQGLDGVARFVLISIAWNSIPVPDEPGTSVREPGNSATKSAGISRLRPLSGK
jgi:hypothetical protein